MRSSSHSQAAATGHQIENWSPDRNKQCENGIRRAILPESACGIAIAIRHGIQQTFSIH